MTGKNATNTKYIHHYRVENNCLQNIAKQDPGRTGQSSNKVHQTTYKTLFSTLYSLLHVPMVKLHAGE